MNKISLDEKELRAKYQKDWDATNVYVKHIGVCKEKDNKDVYVIYQVDTMSRQILKTDHVIY